MYICVCNAVTESQLQGLISLERLVDMESVQAQIKICDQCGICRDNIREMLSEGQCVSSESDTLASQVPVEPAYNYNIIKVQ